MLVDREQKLIKSHGQKMRKFRANLEVERPKIGTAKTKKMGRKELGGIQRAGRNGSGTSAFGKLKQEFNDRKTIIKGGKAFVNSISKQASLAATTSTSFGASVSSVRSTGKKRVLNPSSVDAKKARNVALNNGKKMKMPKLDSLYKNSLRKGR